MMHWRVYCNGREFGIDYPTLHDAQEAKERYRSHFPHHNYYIRRHNGSPLAMVHS